MRLGAIGVAACVWRSSVAEKSREHSNLVWVWEIVWPFCSCCPRDLCVLVCLCAVWSSPLTHLVRDWMSASLSGWPLWEWWYLRSFRGCLPSSSS